MLLPSAPALSECPVQAPTVVLAQPRMARLQQIGAMELKIHLHLQLCALCIKVH